MHWLFRIYLYRLNVFFEKVCFCTCVYLRVRVRVCSFCHVLCIYFPIMHLACYLFPVPIFVLFSSLFPISFFPFLFSSFINCLDDATFDFQNGWIPNHYVDEVNHMTFDPIAPQYMYIYDYIYNIASDTFFFTFSAIIATCCVFF